MSRRSAVLAVFGALACVPQAGAGPGPSAAESAAACATIADPTVRLACYDAAFGVKSHASAVLPAAPAGPKAAGAPLAGSGPAAAPALRPAPSRGAVAPVEFGDQGQLHGEVQARAALPKRLNFRVSKAESMAGGLYRLTMDNGQVWVTKEADWALEFKDGDQVTIQRMVLGNYRVSHSGQGRDVTVARVF